MFIMRQPILVFILVVSGVAVLVISVVAIGVAYLEAPSPVPGPHCDADILGFSQSVPFNCSIMRREPDGRHIDLNVSSTEVREAWQVTYRSLAPITSLEIGKLENPDYYILSQVGMDPVELWVKIDNGKLHFAVGDDDYVYHGGSVQEFSVGVKKLFDSQESVNLTPIPEGQFPRK